MKIHKVFISIKKVVCKSIAINSNGIFEKYLKCFENPRISIAVWLSQAFADLNSTRIFRSVLLLLFAFLFSIFSLLSFVHRKAKKIPQIKVSLCCCYFFLARLLLAHSKKSFSLKKSGNVYTFHKYEILFNTSHHPHSHSASKMLFCYSAFLPSYLRFYQVLVWMANECNGVSGFFLWKCGKWQ